MKPIALISTLSAIFVCAALAFAQEHGEHREAHQNRERGETHSSEARNNQRTQKQVQDHADKLYAAAKKARQDLREMRIAAGLHAHATGPHIDPAGHHANDSPEQRRRERNEGEGHEDGEGRERGERGHREGRGERGHREGAERGHREGRGEHGHREGGEREHGHREGGERNESKPGARIAKMTKHVLTYKNGAKLTLQYNPAIQAFIGNVTNTTKKKLDDVRVEIHLSNGVELGPTKRAAVKPGQTIPVELGAFGEKFKHWTTHPESGNEEAHSEGDEEAERVGGHGGERSGHAERERGEHRREGRGERRGTHAERERGEHSRERRGEHGGHAERERGEKGGGHNHDGAGEGGHGMGDASLRPVYNQLSLLRGEMSAFASDLKAKKNAK